MYPAFAITLQIATFELIRRPVMQLSMTPQYKTIIVMSS